MGAISGITVSEPDPKASSETMGTENDEPSVVSIENSVTLDSAISGTNNETIAETVPSETLNPPDADPKVSSPGGTVEEPSVVSTNIAVTEKSPEPLAPATKSPYDQITDFLLSQIEDFGAASNFKIMIYGDPGCTKSSFIGQAPGNLVWDQEGGMIAAIEATKVTGRPVGKGSKAIPFGSWQRGVELIARLAANDPNFARWNTFSVDTISDLHKRGLAELTENAWLRQPSRPRYKPDTDEYVEINKKMEALVRDIRDLPKDVIITAHARTVEPKGKPAKTYPDFSESLANKLEAMMDIVGYMEMRPMEDEAGVTKEVPVMRVVSNGTIHAKSRIYFGAAELVDPTWEQLKGVWLKAREEGTLLDDEAIPAEA